MQKILQKCSNDGVGPLPQVLLQLWQRAHAMHAHTQCGVLAQGMRLDVAQGAQVLLQEEILCGET